MSQEPRIRPPSCRELYPERQTPWTSEPRKRHTGSVQGGPEGIGSEVAGLGPVARSFAQGGGREQEVDFFEQPVDLLTALVRESLRAVVLGSINTGSRV